MTDSKKQKKMEEESFVTPFGTLMRSLCIINGKSFDWKVYAALRASKTAIDLKSLRKDCPKTEGIVECDNPIDGKTYYTIAVCDEEGDLHLLPLDKEGKRSDYVWLKKPVDIRPFRWNNL